MVVGLGPTSNMNDEYPWGIWITVDIFIIPAAGAAFTTAFMTYFLRRRQYHDIIRPAVLTGFLGYAVVALLLVMDIGRWHQAYNVFLPGFINIHSFLWEIALCVTLYTLVLVVETVPTYLERWNIQNPIRLVNRAILIIAGAGVVLSALHQSSIGSMFLIMSHKLHPLWWSSGLPVFYFVQAVFGGLAMAACVAYVTWSGLGKPVDASLIVRIGRAVRAVLVFYALLRTVDTLMAGEFGDLFTSGVFSVLVLTEIVIGVFAPLGILFSKWGKNVEGVYFSGIFILTGLLLNRLVMSGLGLSVPTEQTYVPHWMELMITVGFISGALLVFGATTRYFEMFPKEH
jgi:Ni/Fe-hydrogenase subunit HybB-like protein